MEWLKQYAILIAVGLVGGGVLIYGLWGVMGGEKATVEIISGSQSSELGNIVVDVAGAVQSPGVYKLPSGSRIGDALVAAEGLAEGADRAWVAQTLNLAEVVKDGGKIYIPARSNNQAPSTNNQTNSNNQNSKLININTASEAELDKLAGIGAARTQTIIANRPYSSTNELVSKAKIAQSVYDKIKDSLSVY